LAIAASMFFAILFLSFILYMKILTINVQQTIVAETHTVIKLLFILNDSFVSVNFVAFTLVENMPANLFLPF
jgi:hypothetical protein